MRDTKNILKIGTTREGIKSASLLGDTFLSLFAQISNPPLTTMNQRGEIYGLVADKLVASEGNTTWKIYIGPNWFWSDGIKLKAEDVLFSITLITEKVPHARWLKGIIGNISIEEDLVLVIDLLKPYSRLDLDLATLNLVPKHIWENIPDPIRHIHENGIVGCGPFVIEKIDLNAGLISYRKNPYWKGQPPELDGLELHLYNNIDVLALALEKGEVGTYYRYASTYPYSNIERLKATDRFDFIEQPHLGLRFLGFNLLKKPMSDIRFRKAISYAIDYKEIIELDTLGYGEIPNTGFIPPAMPGFKETAQLEHDLDRAKNLLVEAGYIDRDADGFRETIDGEEMRLSVLISRDYFRIAELVKDYLETAGINSQLKTVDYNTWISMKDKNDYDLVVSRTSPWGMFMHANWATGYFDARRTGEGVLHNVDDPQFLKLCDDILSTTDAEKLREYASEVQDYYSQFLPAIALYWSRIVVPSQKKFTGWSPNPLYGLFNIQNFLSLRIR